MIDSLFAFGIIVGNEVVIGAFPVWPHTLGPFLDSRQSFRIARYIYIDIYRKYTAIYTSVDG